jgi:hypothetical protein
MNARRPAIAETRTMSKRFRTAKIRPSLLSGAVFMELQYTGQDREANELDWSRGTAVARSPTSRSLDARLRRVPL